MNEPHYLTKEKFEELQKELEMLRTVKRKEVAESLEYSKQLGDLSENAEYHQAREEQALLEDRIAKLSGLLKSAVVMQTHTKTDSVTVGSIVEIQKEGKKEKVTYTLVSSEEADMAAGKISSSAPLGSAMLGKKKGELFSVKTPSGSTSYKIISIS